MQERISEEFKKLIEQAQEEGEHTAFVTTTNEAQFKSTQSKYFSFRTRALNLIRRACGTDSDHYLQLRRLAEGERAANTEFYYACLGITEAAQHDFDAGLLFDIKSLITAELLGNLMEQSEALLQAGYHIPAASLAGAVIEDTLRQLCVNHGIPVQARTTINGLNTLLARGEVYNMLTQKQITAYADIRNNADHGYNDRFTKPDVEEMLTWVRRFTEQHLQ